MPGTSVAGPRVATILVRRNVVSVIPPRLADVERGASPANVCNGCLDVRTSVLRAARRSCRSIRQCEVEHVSQSSAGLAQPQLGHRQFGLDVGLVDLVPGRVEAGFSGD